MLVKRYWRDNEIKLKEDWNMIKMKMKWNSFKTEMKLKRKWNEIHTDIYEVVMKLNPKYSAPEVTLKINCNKIEIKLVWIMKQFWIDFRWN